jgi:hypothetical protein
VPEVQAYGEDTWAQAQPGPQPPDGATEVDAAGLEPEAPTEANTDSSRVVAACPAGHLMGEEASDMGRRASKRRSQTRQRYS